MFHKYARLSCKEKFPNFFVGRRRQILSSEMQRRGSFLDLMGTVIVPFMKLEDEADYERLVELAENTIDFWAENGLEHERCGEMIERIGLVNFLEGIGIEVDPHMIADPRQSSYVRMDGWDEEAVKWFERQAESAQSAAG